jgi:hypothetical protein
MSTTVLKQTEREFERAVLDYAWIKKWVTYHTFDSRRSNPGFPDLVLVRKGCLLLVELKSEKGRVSLAQREWLTELGNVKGWHPESVRVCLWRPSDWDEIERVLA